VAAGRVLVVGYGNSLRGDDAVGQVVAEALSAAGDHVPGLERAMVVAAQQLTPEMALDLSRSAFAVFVDAACDGRPAGSVTVQILDATSAREPAAAGNAAAVGCWQDLTPSGLVALARDLYDSAPPAAVVTVGVADVRLGMGLSPAVSAAVPRAAAAVRLAIAASSGPGRSAARPGPPEAGRVSHA